VATAATNQPTVPVRRSTRLPLAIPITIIGVDVWRAPYNENVSTVNVSAHGCRYDSVHKVLTGALVVLEMKTEHDEAPRSARGRVKYVRYPDFTGQPFQTAVEFDDPCNIWGLNDPPKDWLPFCGPKSVDLDTSRPKPFAVPRAEANGIATEQKISEVVKPPKAQTISPPPPGTPIANVIGGFQQQLENMLSEAVDLAVRDRANSTFQELRGNLEREIKEIVTEAARATANTTAQKSLQQFRARAQESVDSLRNRWLKEMEAELQLACDRIQTRGREMDEVSQALSTSALEKLQRSIEALRRDSVDRIIARLKEQSVPLLDRAQKMISDLNKSSQQFSAIVGRSLGESTAQIKQVHGELEKQFEKTIRGRLETAQAEIERATRAAITEALSDLRGLSQKHEAEATARVQNAVAPLVQESLQAFREKANETSQQFASEIENYSRSHLEYVGGAISELAKGVGKKDRG